MSFGLGGEQEQVTKRKGKGKERKGKRKRKKNKIRSLGKRGEVGEGKISSWDGVVVVERKDGG